MTEPMTLGERIRAARERVGIYQCKLAEMLGLTSGRIISNWETGVARPDADNLVKLCEALDVSAAYILGYDGKATETLTERESDHLKRYRALDDHGKEIVDLITEKELSRMTEAAMQGKKLERRHRTLLFFDSAASAGTGQYIGEVEGELIRVQCSEEADNADYVIPVKGDSMEPVYFDGDRVGVCEAESIDDGEVGIFVVNGESYIKCFKGDRLVSFNRKYPDIILSECDSVFCRGFVTGKIKC